MKRDVIVASTLFGLRTDFGAFLFSPPPSRSRPPSTTLCALRRGPLHPPEGVGGKGVDDVPLFPGPLLAGPVDFAGPVSFDELQSSSSVNKNYYPSYTGLLPVYLLREWLGAEAG
jgi:hypothetical protein